MTSKRNDRKEQRREEALDRQAARDNRTDDQQMQLIALRRGHSIKESARLGRRS